MFVALRAGITQVKKKFAALRAADKGSVLFNLFLFYKLFDAGKKVFLFHRVFFITRQTVYTHIYPLGIKNANPKPKSGDPQTPKSKKTIL